MTWISICCYCSVTKSCPTLYDPMDCSMPGFPVLHHHMEFVQTHVHWVSDVIQPSCPLSSPSLPAFNLSQHQGLFQWVGSLHPNYWNFSCSISPSNEHSELISFRIDSFDLLAVQGILKCSPISQFESINSSLALSLLYGPVSIYIHDYLEKEMATHSSILAGRIPGTGSLVGYSPWGHKELGTTEKLSTWLLEKPEFWLYEPLLAKWHLCFLIHCLGLS